MSKLVLESIPLYHTDHDGNLQPIHLNPLTRVKIHGGWLILSRSGRDGITFVPDPEHKWELHSN